MRKKTMQGRYRRDIIRRHLEGLNKSQIARDLGVNWNTVHLHINRYIEKEANKTQNSTNMIKADTPKTFNLIPTLNYKKAIKTRKPWSVKIEDDKPVAKMYKLEEQVKELKKINSKLAKTNMDLIEQAYERETRGFWARLFNK